MSSVGKKLLAIKNAYDIRIQLLESRLSAQGCMGVNEAYRATVPVNERSQEKVSSIYNVLAHVFDVSYFAMGRDVVGQSYSKLNENQQDWLKDRCEELQHDLLQMHRRMTLFTLEKNGYELEGLANIHHLSLQQQNAAYQRALLGVKDVKAKLIIDEMQQSWQEMCLKIQTDLFPAPLQTVSQASSSLSLLSSSLDVSSSIVNSVADVFLRSEGWADAGAHHVNLPMYWLSDSYRQGVVDRELIECCGSICCSDNGSCSVVNACHSCGQMNCACPTVTCPSCHCPECSCDCSCCGDCRSACRDNSCDANCCGVTITVGGGGCITIGKAATTGDDAIPANQPVPSPYNSTQIAQGPLGQTMHDGQLLLTSNGGESTSSTTHNTFLTSTAAQAGARFAFMALASGHALRAVITPLINCAQGYKIGRSSLQLTSGAALGTGLAVASYFPQKGGPHTAYVTGITGMIAGYQFSKVAIQQYAKRQFNGISNPAKWMLTSDVLQKFVEFGYKPQEIVQMIELLREMKDNGVVRTNNKAYGAFRMLRGLGYLTDCCKDELEIAPDKILWMLHKNDRKAFETLRSFVPGLRFFHEVQDVHVQRDTPEPGSDLRAGPSLQRMD